MEDMGPPPKSRAKVCAHLRIQGSHRNMKTKFQDFSRIIPELFSIFKGSISLTISQFFIVFAGNGDSETGRTSILSPGYFHYGIDKYQDYRLTESEHRVPLALQRIQRFSHSFLLRSA